MPEVAEVAITAEILHKKLKGKQMNSFEFISGRYTTKKAPEEYGAFVKALPMTVVKVDSIGKFMWMELIGKKTWYVWNTFGLCGSWTTEESDHTRAIVSYDNNEIYFCDQIGYGTFKFSKDWNTLNAKCVSLSPDFLKDEEFDMQKIKKINKPIMKILMDQKKIGSGIGNYLSTEILYRAKLSPHRLGSSLSNEDLDILEYWIKYVTKLSYVDNHVGYMTEFEDIVKQDYHQDIELEEETFDFKIYKKKVDPYGNKVSIDKMDGPEKNKRSAYWVPAIQK